MSIKKISKIVVVLMLIATVLSAVSMVFATTGSAVTIPGGDDSGYDDTGLSETVSRVIGIVQLICYAAAVILIVILGIRFMMASPDGKAEIKKSAVIYIVGAVLVFAAGVILHLIQNVSNRTVENKAL